MLARVIIRAREVKRRTGLSSTTIWRHEREGLFPERVRLTEGGATGWYEDEVDARIHNRIRGGGRRPVCEDSAGDPPSDHKRGPRRNPTDDDQPEPPPMAA